MKTKQIFTTLAILSILVFTSISYGFITPTASGNWSSTNAGMPWPGGILPTTNDFVEVLNGIVITNDMTNATCQALDSTLDGGNGTVIMTPGSTLIISGQNEGYGTQSLGILDATATNCTVIYQGNAFWAKRTDYWNLVFSGWGDFYNGAIPGYPTQPMTIYGNFIVNGTNVPPDQTNGYSGVYVECGDNFNILGNLYIGASNAWDCSIGIVTVMSNTTCAGVLWDKDAVNGSNYFGGGLTILPSSMLLTNVHNTLVSKMGITNAGVEETFGGALYVADVTQWTIGGNFTNNGIVGFGANYGSIDFAGTGVIAGSNAFTIPTMTVDGKYEIDTTITLTTNTPTLNGTLVFDLASTNKIIYFGGTNALYYSGILDVTNRGAAPVSGNSYQFFNASSYGGTFASENFPPLPSGLSWVDNLNTSGSIAVTGTAAGGSPTITSFQYNPVSRQFTLTWTSQLVAQYTVQETPSLNPVAWSPLQINIPSGGSTTTTTVTMPVGTKGFLRILQQ